MEICGVSFCVLSKLSCREIFAALISTVTFGFGISILCGVLVAVQRGALGLFPRPSQTSEKMDTMETELSGATSVTLLSLARSFKFRAVVVRFGSAEDERHE